MVQEALEAFDVFLVLRVHDRYEQGVDVLLDVLDFVQPLADDVVQLDQPLGIVGLDVHQRIDPVVGVRVVREEVAHRVAFLQDAVQLMLDLGVADGLLAQGLVAGVEDADALPDPPVEAVGPGEEAFENLLRAFQAVEQGVVERAAEGAGHVLEHPFVLFFGRQAEFETVVSEQVVEKRPPVGLGDQQQRVVVAGAGNLEEAVVHRSALARPAGKPPPLLFASGAGLTAFDAVDDPREPLDQGVAPIAGRGAEPAPVEAPHHLVAQAALGGGINLELLEQVGEKGALAAPRGAAEDVDLVLLGAAFHGFGQVHHAVGEESVGEEGVVHLLDEEPVAVVIDEVDRLGVVGVFVDPLPHIGRDHVMHHLEDGAHDDGRARLEFAQKVGKSDRLPVLTPARRTVKALQGRSDGVFACGRFGPGIGRRVDGHQITSRVNVRSFMV
jgi:hypothetical protein